MEGYEQRIKPNFSITAEEFQSRKKRRLEEMRKPHRTSFELPPKRYVR